MSSVEQEIMQLEAELREAVLNRDCVALNRLLAEDFVTINPDGSIASKAEHLANTASLDFVLESLELKDVHIRHYGAAAVLMGRTVMKGRYRSAGISGQYRYVHVYVRKDAGWQVVSGQATAITREAVSEE